MAPRKSGTTSIDNGPDRMPFATAEALLWGPELRKQHEWLLKEMRALQSQHGAYDARIQTTEAVAEAAKAATSCIRHIEQQIAAMEVVDNDKAFEKWATEEITRLKIFADRNQSIRQKQVELEKEVSVISDGMDKIKDVSKGLKGLLQRFELLESGHKQDVHRVKTLEAEIVSLKTAGQKTIMSKIDAGVKVDHRPILDKPDAPPRVQDVEESEATETEDEGLALPHTPNKVRIQVPRSPQVEHTTSNTIFVSSPTRVQPAVSARLRLFKRPSIHNSKLPTEHKEIQERVTASKPVPYQQRAHNPPATQLVNKANPKKRKFPEDGYHTGRITRSQARKQERGSEQTRNLETIDGVSTEPAELVGRSPVAQKKLGIMPAPSKKPSIEPTQIATSSLRKRKKVTVAPLQRLAGLQTDDSGSEYLSLNAADRVKTTPRASAMASPSKAPTRLSCNACHRQKTKCDRARPYCGQCAKRLQSHACQYVQPPVGETQLVSTLASRPPKNTIQANTSAELSRSGVGTTDANHNSPRSSSRTMSPKKPQRSKPSVRTAPPPSIAGPADSSARRVMPNITDYNTYLKMKADKEIL
ncbi:Nn.00g057550.m01.CDS01 [Neocucurbitaria sp. VM-36]